MPPEQGIRLVGRSGSHFTRVAAMFAHELRVPFELDIVHDLLSLDPAMYGGHPALKLPTLHVGDSALFGTENICRKLAELADRARDPRVVLPEHVTADLARSAQELAWHAMAVQVQLLVGIRFAKLPEDNVFFAKAKAGMVGSLTWLDQHLERALDCLPAPRDVSVLELTLFCLVEHIVFRPTLPLDAYPTLRSFAATFAARESAQRTVFHADPAPTQDQKRR